MLPKSMSSKYSHTNTLNIDDVLIFNETRTKNLLGKDKGGLSTILHILWSNVHMASVLLTGYAALSTPERQCAHIKF